MTTQGPFFQHQNYCVLRYRLATTSKTRFSFTQTSLTSYSDGSREKLRYLEERMTSGGGSCPTHTSWGVSTTLVPSSHCAVSSSPSFASATGKHFTMQITHLAEKRCLDCTDSPSHRRGVMMGGGLPLTQSSFQASTDAERKYSLIWTTTACL